MFPEILIGLAVATALAYLVMKQLLKVTPPRDHMLMTISMIIPMGLVMAAIAISIGMLLSPIM